MLTFGANGRLSWLFGDQRCLIVTVVQRGDRLGIELLVDAGRLRSSMDMAAAMRFESGDPACLQVARQGRGFSL